MNILYSFTSFTFFLLFFNNAFSEELRRAVDSIEIEKNTANLRVLNKEKYVLSKDGVRKICESNSSMCYLPIDLCSDLFRELNDSLGEPPSVFDENKGGLFLVPDWKPVASENIDWDMLKEADYILRNGGKDTSADDSVLMSLWEQRKNKYQILALEKTILWYAEFDLDNNKGNERIYKLTKYEWDEKVTPKRMKTTPTMMVVDKKGGNDDRYSMLLYSSGDAFFYKGHTYLLSWGKRSGGLNYLYVSDSFMPRDRYGLSNKAQCEFDYIEN